MDYKKKQPTADCIVARLVPSWGSIVSLLFKTTEPYEHYYDEHGEEIPYGAIESWIDVKLPSESEDEKIRKIITDSIFYQYGAGTEYEDVLNYLDKLEKQKEQKSKILIPKFQVGDTVISTKNNHLTYEILEIGHINELENPEYKVEIFVDGKPDKPRNIKYIEIEKMDSWGELIQQKTTECSKDERIRKAILGLTYLDGIEPILTKCSITARDIRIYLEKQKEQKDYNKLYEDIDKSEWFKKSIEDAAKEATKDKESAEKFLKTAGIVDENGNLAEIYRSEQGSTEWSEEDDVMLDKVCCLISPGTKLTDDNTDYCVELKQWIFSLRERILGFLSLQPKQEWSEDFDKEVEKIHKRYPEVSFAKLTRIAYHFSKWANRCKDIEWSEEDNNIKEQIIIDYEGELRKLSNSTIYEQVKPIYQKRIDWLKSLPERFNLQPKAEWSEEDKNKFDLLHTCICRCIIDPYWDYSKREKVSKEIIPFFEKLKSLRPQLNTVSTENATKFGNLEYERGVKDGIQREKSHQWKPSEKQMKLLEVAIAAALDNNKSSKLASGLITLRKDLEKL